VLLLWRAARVSVRLDRNVFAPVYVILSVCDCMCAWIGVFFYLCVCMDRSAFYLRVCVCVCVFPHPKHKVIVFRSLSIGCSPCGDSLLQPICLSVSLSLSLSTAREHVSRSCFRRQPLTATHR
jgi:hypothetical protein